MSDQSLGGFAANFAFNLQGVALVEGAVKAVERLNAAVQRREKVHGALTTIYGDKNKAAELIGVSADEGAINAERAEKRAGALEKVFHALSVAQMAYAAAANVASRFTGMLNESLDEASHAVEISQKVGISAEAVQELGFAAGQSGSNTEQLAAGLERLAKNAKAATSGSKQARAAFREAGVDVHDIVEGHEQLDGVLEQVANKFASMPDGAAKSALAMRLFGRAGVELIPLLNEGAAGVQDLRAEAQNLGIVLDNDAAASMEAMGDDVDKFKLSLHGLRNQVVAAVLPALSSLIRTTQAWLNENREGIVKAMAAGVQVLVGALKIASTIMGGFVSVVTFLAKDSDVLVAVLFGLAAAVLYLKAGFLALKIEALLAWAAAAGPATLAAAGIALAVAAVVLLFLKFRSVATAVLHAFGRAAEWVGEKFKAVWRVLKTAANEVGDFFASIGAAIKSAFHKVVDWIVDKVDWVIDRVNDLIDMINNLPGIDIGRLGHLGGGNAAPAPPTVPLPAAGGAKSVAMTNTINVSSPNANPEQVASLVVEKVNGLLREADAAIA